MKPTPALFVNRRPITLLTPRDNPQNIVWQWLLQCHRFVDRARKPCVPFLLCSQKNRHCLSVDRAHNVIRFSGQERKQLMLAGLSLSFAGPKPPNPCESKKWPAFVERKPMGDFRPAVGPFAK